MDSHYYGMNYFIDEIESRLSTLTRDQVNAAIREHLQSENYRAVLVTADAADLQTRLEAGEPSPMTYNTPPDDDVVEADKTIQEFPVRPTEIRVVPVAEMFEE